MPCSIERVPLPVVIGLVVRNLSYVPSLSHQAVLSAMLAVLCLCLRVRHYLSVLVYAGLSLFIISGPYLYMVVCVLYAYNLTVGGVLSP